MDNPKKIQFLIAHYSMLQGLKMIPLGVVAIAAPIWGQQNAGKLPQLSWFFVFLIAMIGLMFVIEWWYKRTYGDIRRTLHERLVDGVLMGGGGVLGLAVFFLDYFVFRSSGVLFGLLFAAALIADYVRALIAIGERNIWLFPVPPLMAIVMALSSLLTLLGIPWWQFFGFRMPWSGVMVLMGLLIILMGIFSHIYLMRAFSHSPEAQNGHAI
jgi:hypothetical protein